MATGLISLAMLILLCTLLSNDSNQVLKWRKKRLTASRLSDSNSRSPTPPIVYIPREIQFSEAGHDAYNEALDRYGDVVIIPRHGRMEYVVDHIHVKDVLTDATNYSFEKAVTKMLHMEFMLWFKGGTFVQEMDSLVQDGVTPRLRSVVERILPIFAKESDTLWIKTADGKVMEIADMYEWVHYAIAQAMVVLILGEPYRNANMTRNFMEIVVAIAHLSGIYENTQGWRYFPSLWSFKTTMVAIFGTIIPRFFFGILPQLWRNRDMHLNQGADTADSTEYAPFLDLLTVKYRNSKTGQISLLNFIWCAIICLGVIFASIHQTAVVAVWCIFNLAKRQDEYLGDIRAEMKQHLESDAEGNTDLSMESLRNLTKLDSFIREVMRIKGDTFAPVRYTTKDVQVGQYIIPQDSLCAPYVKRAHERAGRSFRGFQWHEKERPAVQGNVDFISFGLGRWACPGRHLAISEIKIIMITLFERFDVRLANGDFSTSDPMNATSVAPEAVVLVSRRQT
ncbi:hypothetical protein CBS101457_003281 [Exobasidium rhododendri]|nr:hypothetical protein CBS101457_003281 [Exobasidium rhododendri]